MEASSAWVSARNTSSKERGRFWYAVVVCAASTVVAVLYSVYKRSEAADRS